MATQDSDGNEYAKLSELKAGDEVSLDEGFSCMPPGTATVHERDGRLFVTCDEGEHWLDGQDDGDGYCVGVYKE